jgi:sugar lactone lactonase YvrE
MLTLQTALRAAVLAATALLLSACNDGYGDNCDGCVPPAVRFNIQVSGLAGGTSVELGDDTGIVTTLSANGSTSYVAYEPYWPTPALVGVLVQPAGQNCIATNGAVDANANVAVNVSCTALPGSPPPALSILAGLLDTGSADGTGTAASFSGPSAVAVDASGNVYVADTNNCTIRKVAAGGVVTTLAGAAGLCGNIDGTGAGARFYGPNGVATDTAGNVYVADTFNNTVRVITPAGVVTTLAGSAGAAGSTDGTGAAARFWAPVGIAVNSAGTVYVTDFNNSTVRAITPGGVVTTLAGTAGTPGSTDGTGAAARFWGPQGIGLDTAGNLYVADSWNNTIRKVTPGGVVSTVAGLAGVAGAANGSTSAATFWAPLDVAVDSAGDLYVTDNGNDLVRKITAAGVVSTVVGTAGQNVFSAGLLPGSLQNPTSLALNGSTLVLTTINAVAQVPNVP